MDNSKKIIDKPDVIKGGYDVVTPNPPTPQPAGGNWGTPVPTTPPPSSSSDKPSSPAPVSNKK